MFSPLTSRTVASSKSDSRQGHAVTRLIVHHTAGGGDEHNVRYLSTGAAEVSSSYVLLTSGELVGIVDEDRRPWTTGWDADKNAVTVETVNTSGAPEWLVSAAQVEMIAQLAADLCKRYGWGRLDRSRVRGHREFNATACPGPYLWGALDAIVARANEIVGAGGSAPAPVPSAAPPFPLPSDWYFGPQDGPEWSVSGFHGNREHLKRWQQRMRDRGWLLTADGLYGPETRRITRAFQAEKGLTVDGLIGPATWAAAWTEPVT